METTPLPALAVTASIAEAAEWRRAVVDAPRTDLVALHNHYNPGKPISLAMWWDESVDYAVRFAILMDGFLGVIPEPLRPAVKHAASEIAALRTKHFASGKLSGKERDFASHATNQVVELLTQLHRDLEQEQAPPATIYAVGIFLAGKGYRRGGLPIARFTEREEAYPLFQSVWWTPRPDLGAMLAELRFLLVLEYEYWA